ncbi:MAG: polysaccharide deacetylase family protein, partial [Desulfovibrionaceae bacterium]|nr:polysaccharide deacetylase family protein [Desulfovibrionaceae bacterium]
MSAKCLSLPVLNYHSVCDRPHNLSVPTAIFEAHCRTAAENGWFGVSLEQAEEFFLRGRDLPPRSFLITLDDGYLDNYVYAWPILRKYGHKAVIFPVADSISAASAPCPRPTLEDVWGGVLAMEELPGASTGEGVLLTRRDWFFTWDEARLML